MAKDKRELCYLWKAMGQDGLEEAAPGVFLVGAGAKCQPDEDAPMIVDDDDSPGYYPVPHDSNPLWSLPNLDEE